MPDQGKLARYAELVRVWSERLDLVSPADLQRFEARHVADSLRLLDLLAETPDGPCADVGSGAGLPGIPLAIAGGRRWRLFEPRARRAAFLEEVVRTLELDCEVLAMTAEAAAERVDLAGVHVVVTARALAPPVTAFELICPLVAPGGRAVVFHGPGAELPPEAVEWADGIATIEVPGEPPSGEEAIEPG
jgi:16S rRNA (guanine527-N7)-methyltransferase